jgi:hypothetical protein
MLSLLAQGVLVLPQPLEQMGQIHLLAWSQLPLLAVAVVVLQVVETVRLVVQAVVVAQTYL